MSEKPEDPELWWARRVWALYQSAFGQNVSFLASGRQGGHTAFKELVERAEKVLAKEELEKKSSSLFKHKKGETYGN